MAEPGWYKDHADERLARWHDGERWTEHTMVMADWAGPGIPPPPPSILPAQPAFGASPRSPAPSPVSRSTPPRLAGRSNAQVVVLGAAVVIGISCFLPWIKVVFIGTITASGTDASGGDGWIFLGGAVLLGLVAWFRPLRVPALMLSILGIIGFIYERHHIGTSKEIPISIGIGLWLILAASVIAAAACTIEITEGSQPPASVGFLPAPARRYWWGISTAVVLLAGALVYGQEHHRDVGFNADTGSTSLESRDTATTSPSARPPKVEVAEAGFSAYASDFEDKPQGTAGAIIKNPGNKTVSFLTVVFTFKDASGAPVGTETDYVDAVPPGGEAYAEVDGVDLTGSATSIEANAVDDNDTYSGIAIPVNSATVSHDKSDYSGQEVHGAATNPTSKVVESASVSCIGRLKGKIVAGISTSLDTMAPGASVAWSTEFDSGLTVDAVQCSAGQSN